MFTSCLHYTKSTQKIKHNSYPDHIFWHERVISLNTHIFFPAGHTEALDYCIRTLRYRGCSILSSPTDQVTHLLLPVPSFEPNGSLKGGGELEDVLKTLPKNITVIGGNLAHPALTDYAVIDLLQDPIYLAENANITAHCALTLVMKQLPVTLQGCPVLIVGWGRIGKCLAALLRQLGAHVSVYARKESDKAMLLALGYDIADIAPPAYDLMRYRVIFNTAPYMVLPAESLKNCRPECLKIDLASVQGMEGNNVIWARGLPNKNTPESSGELIARTILRLVSRKEHLL